jgi:hypothetical protein
VIEKGLLLVQNELFRRRLREKFDRKYLCKQEPNLFKQINNPDNPLYQLIQIDRKGDVKSLLILNLTELICHKIEIKKDELLNETFLRPTRTTFTYAVLNEKLFKNLSIRKEIIEHLISLWNEWEKEGCQIRQINHWNNELNYDQQQIAGQIWNFIGENIGKPIELEKIIEEARRNVQDIVKTVENATLCINNYCQNACDRNDYLTHLQDLRNQLHRTTVYSAKVSRTIQILKPFADRLEPVISSYVWQTYLKQNLESKSKFRFLQKWFRTVV